MGSEKAMSVFLCPNCNQHMLRAGVVAYLGDDNKTYCSKKCMILARDSVFFDDKFCDLENVKIKLTRNKPYASSFNVGDFATHYWAEIGKQKRKFHYFSTGFDWWLGLKGCKIIDRSHFEHYVIEDFANV